MARSLSTGEGPRELPVVAFAGGGTAGHVFPGLAVAAWLGRRVIWIGSSRGVERKLVADAGIEFRGIPAGKLRRYLSIRNLTDIVKTAAGIVASLRIMRKDKPALLFSKGGFVSVPPVLAAWLRGIPAWTHESDFDPGLATRINLRFCERVLVSFPETLERLPVSFRHKAVVTGNPVRSALYTGQPRRGRAFVRCESRVPLLLVIGGSLGSSFVNSLVAASLPRLLPRFFVVHQMGAKEFVPANREGYFPAPFFGEELPDLMAAADLVISRAGANILSEIAALGKPSILIPLPASGSRGDQLRNAALFRERGASLVLEEGEATPDALVSAVEALFHGDERRAELGRCALKLGGGRPDKAIADLIIEKVG
jgi:UDP-N-acetylglucosamine--N-acetylmuramyl-(pentapeptide) pyrophosphoryl-undecaprenol N-acetylglucosamine transferase